MVYRVPALAGVSREARKGGSTGESFGCLRFVGINSATLLLALMNWSLPLLADDLPSDLSLYCEGTLNTRTVLPKLETYDEQFNITLRLNDRVLTNVTDNMVMGRDCILNIGDVDCKLDATRYYKEFNPTMVQHFLVLLTRKTGELYLLLQTKHFDGQGASGSPTFDGKLEWRGVCDKGKSIF